MTGETDTVGRKRRAPGAGHRGKGRGCGPASYAHSDKPRAAPLDTSSEKQRAHVLKRWAAHRERVAQGPDAVAQHARMLRFKKARVEIKKEKRRTRATLPPPARSMEGE